MMKLRFIHINTYNRPLTVNPHVHNVYEFVYYINAQGYSMYGKSSAYIESGQFLAYTDNVRNGDVFYLVIIAISSIRRERFMMNTIRFRQN